MPSSNAALDALEADMLLGCCDGQPTHGHLACVWPSGRAPSTRCAYGCDDGCLSPAERDDAARERALAVLDTPFVYTGPADADGHPNGSAYAAQRAAHDARQRAARRLAG